MFSIIIPLFNKVHYCGKTIESVLSQTFKDWECVIVDDGSTDGSGTIADSYAAIHANITVVHQNNAGVAAARNNGVKHTQGEYIVFLDADDWWSPIFLEKMNVLIDMCPEAGIYGVNYFYHKNGQNEVRVHVNTGYINYFKTYATNLQMPLTSISVCIPRRIFNEVKGFPDLRLGEDFMVWVQIALKYKVAFYNEPLAYYNQDIPVKLRAVGNLIPPVKHMLWNLTDSIKNAESNNQDLKILLDNLRVYGMKPYFISRNFHNESLRVLDNVDWSQQPLKEKLYYKAPRCILLFLNYIQKKGSLVKRTMKSYIYSHRLK